MLPVSQAAGPVIAIGESVVLRLQHHGIGGSTDHIAGGVGLALSGALLARAGIDSGAR